ncbi:fumarate reductase subunit D [Halieaceae bacterium IMCC14734]|uniref:Fumarate reductase subunit D n=1 Tax=Candidatus Litorirhabdus singularis TaxID=2518993 RepID=A0ABT3TEE2_9GAMM|nr:fumarate reductase subunit FrdD [Candidatus Litorirhabdus singularis]MCX2980681.1 fumarate reductase subunit D [Candidatus Litorirhabdus singularis]
MLSSQSKPQRQYPRSHEPIVWSLFGAGGMVVAFLLPAAVLITGFIAPLGVAELPILSYSLALEFCRSWWGSLFILVCIVLPAFHAAHRLYHGMHDLHLRGANWLMLTVFYGGASGLACATLFYLWILRH